jgi:hypothetical protein
MVLIMANEDQANLDSPSHGVSWHSIVTDIPDARSYVSGATNTAAIIAALPHDDSSNNAAWLCHNYRDRGGHDDWYLPSRDELYKMYLAARERGWIGKSCAGSVKDGVQCLMGGYVADGGNSYWSSTQYAGEFNYGDDAWSLDFISGSFNQSIAGDHFGVRAVRVFDNSLIQQSFVEAILTFVLGTQNRVGKGSPAQESDLYILQRVAAYTLQSMKDSA